MKLYLAGPDVFRPDAAQWAASVRLQCSAAGHEALVPLDSEPASAAAIFRNNLRLIAEADCVVANLNPFRGAEPDSGTCVEIGYALALGKPVVGYAADLRPLRERLAAADADGVCRDAAGWQVEDFALPMNLMLAVPLRLAQGGLADALRELDRA
ncbi:MAG: nucleoside 2-deoxyribosyltransferase [Rhodocyclales bacterium]|nr:nucleoside 2-deoxyribosyltransferase [Rhodocyclales bacterium]